MKSTLIIILLIWSVSASCHHNCNDHGECIGSTCECNSDWTGDDCSLEYLELTAEHSMSKSITNGDWIYFWSDIGPEVLSMTYNVHDHLGGDCDLFIRYENFPTKNHHDYYDNSWENDFSISISSPQAGRWIAGVYNFLLCEFDIILHLQNAPQCPNDCSGHGTCLNTNECSCDTGYGGQDCSQEYENLSDGESHEGSVGIHEWKVYYFDSVLSESTQSCPDFTIVVNQTQTSGDGDLYVRFEELPTLQSWDFRDAATMPNYALTVGSPREGRYYISIYGYEPAAWAIRVQLHQDIPCADLCSNHGVCLDNVCQCNPGFSGDHCEYMNENLEVGQSVGGYAGSNQWNYYQVTANSASNMVIQVEQSFTRNGDCDLYIRANEYPDKFHYDLRDIGFDQSFSLVVENPLQTPWKIGVYGYRACDYFISYSLQATCPNACSGHGTCQNGRCACASGFAGLDCGSTLGRVHSGTPINGTVSQNQWVYYKYTAPAGHSSVTVELYEYTSVGYVQLYVQQGAPPDLISYTWSDSSAERALHNIYFLTDGQGDLDYYIGVYGSAFIPILTQQPFELLAYSPPI